MIKLNKKIVTLMLSLAVFATTFSIAGIIVQAKPVTTKKLVVYLNGKSVPTPAKIEITDLAESDLFDINSVSSSKPRIVSIQSVTQNSITDKVAKYEYSDVYSDYSGNAYIEIMCNKAGSSVISYKINGKTYKTTVKVVKYTNAVKTLKLTGIDKGKNQASEFKIRTISPYLIEKNIKNPILTIVAKKGWKITEIKLDSYKGIGNTSYPFSFSAINYNYGVSKASLRLNTLKAKNSAILAVTMQNKKNYGTIVYYCYFNYGGE